jgi:hypothetical protein
MTHDVFRSSTRGWGPSADARLGRKELGSRLRGNGRSLSRRFSASVIFIFAISFAEQVDAASHRWTIAFAQGTLEAIIHNDAGASLNIYCPSGQTDRTPGMFLESKKLHPQKSEQVDVQIVVDGREFPFRFDEIQFSAAGRDDRAALSALIGALVKSKRAAFTVELPRLAQAEAFSLRGAKKALVSAAEFLDGCGEAPNDAVKR